MRMQLIECRKNFISYIVICILLSFICFESKAEGNWAKIGATHTSKSAASDRMLSPDGNWEITFTKNGLMLNKTTANPVLIPIDLSTPLWEVVWASNSQSFAVNFSDGGSVGTWDTVIFRLDKSSNFEIIKPSRKIRKVAKDFPACFSIEEVNVATIGWSNDSVTALLIAEVPPHSSCKNMGSLKGFKFSVTSRKILGSLSENELRNKWKNNLGPRIR